MDQNCLEEKGLWRDLHIDGTKFLVKCRAPCCATAILRNESDFHSQTGQVQEFVEAAGHAVIFYPKFFCKLNFMNVSDPFANGICEIAVDILSALRETIPLTLRSVPTKTMNWSLSLTPRSPSCLRALFSTLSNLYHPRTHLSSQFADIPNNLTKAKLSPQLSLLFHAIQDEVRR